MRGSPPSVRSPRPGERAGPARPGRARRRPSGRRQRTRGGPDLDGVGRRSPHHRAPASSSSSPTSGGVAGTFFNIPDIKLSFHEIVRAFWTNIWVACVSEVLVLILGLLVAIVRMLPGRAGAPLRADRGGLLRRVPGDPGDRGHPADRLRPAADRSQVLPDACPTGLARHHRADPDLHRLRLGGLPGRSVVDPSEPERRRPVAWVSATRRPCAPCWCRRPSAG